jgi:hypothetical protein
MERITGPSRRRYLAALGIQKGWHCLEVGAGHGVVARWLAEQVGPTGRVVATDINGSAFGMGAYLTKGPSRSQAASLKLRTFDDPNWIRPQVHGWARSALHWVLFPTDVEVFKTTRLQQIKLEEQ